MDLALNNLQRLICHKTQPTNQPIYTLRMQKVWRMNWQMQKKIQFKFNSKIVIIAELTIPFETNIDWAHQRKLEKYEGLREQCTKNDWSTDIFPLEIGCRGFILNATSTFFTKIGLTPAKKREYIKKDPKQDCNCIWTDKAFVQIKHHPIKSGSIVRYCWGTLG